MQVSTKNRDTVIRMEPESELDVDMVKNGACASHHFVTGCDMATDTATHAIAHMELRLPALIRRGDADISAAAVSQIKAWISIPVGTVQVTVLDGWITAKGEVEFLYQKSAIESAVKHLPGVKGVINLILLRPHLAPMDVEQIAFKASACCTRVPGQLGD